MSYSPYVTLSLSGRRSGVSPWRPGILDRPRDRPRRFSESNVPSFAGISFHPLRFEDTRNEVIAALLLAFSLGDVAVESVITHHLFSPVRDVRTHGGHPFQGEKTLVCSAIFGCMDDVPLLIQLLHSFPGERYPDDQKIDSAEKGKTQKR